MGLASAIKAAIKLALQHAPGPFRPFADRVLQDRHEYNLSYLYCDDPHGGDPRPLTSEITVSGRCFTVRADDLVRVRIGETTPVRVSPIPDRGDRSQRPLSHRTGHSDFVARVPAAGLPNGWNQIEVSLISRGRTLRTALAKVNIDHQRGFASDYYRWIEDFERPERERIREAVQQFSYRPCIGMPEDANLAAADYVCWLEEGTTLDPDALAYIQEALNRDPEIDFIYADDDEIGPDTLRTRPFFKPDWSPDLILSMNYIGGMAIVKRDLFAQVSGEDGYRFILNAATRARKIHHIPHVLSHRLTRPAFDPPPPPAKRHQTAPPRTAVSIIIPSGGRVDMLKANLESLLSENSFSNFEILVIDNSSTDALQQFLHSEWRHEKRLRTLHCRGQRFNYSALNNYAVSRSRNDVFLFLNDDTSACEDGWIESMLEHALRPEVGAVGAKLVYPNGLIQHAGIMLGVLGTAGHAFKGLPSEKPHYFGLSDVIRNVSAVTGACLMTRRGVFEQVGGFDETEFAVAFNDVDLCLKMGRLGYRILYTPFAVLYHHEAISKSAEDLVPATPEVAALSAKWGRYLANDPFYNPNLTRDAEDYSVQTKLPRIRRVPGAELWDPATRTLV